jgi:hypothetical protein
MNDRVGSGVSTGFAEPDVESSDPAARLQRLLNQIRTRSQRVLDTPRRLAIEVDGECLGHAELNAPQGREQSRTRPSSEVGPLALEELHFDLPAEAKSLALVDEAKQIRAHVLLAEQRGIDAHFDNGRLQLRIDRDDDGAQRLCLRYQVD